MGIEDRSRTKACCAKEKQRLAKQIEKCKTLSGYQSFHNCAKAAARDSKRRSKACMLR